MKILVFNAGSSTHKCALYSLDKMPEIAEDPIWEGFLDWGDGSSSLRMRICSKGKKKESNLLSKSIHNSVLEMLKTAWEGEFQVINDPADINVVGHRIVHGGEKFHVPSLITKEVKKTLLEISNLAPLHNPASIEGIEILEKIFPKVPQIAVFDTGFHYAMPEEVCTYPIPYKWRKEGIRRYGFHGISHQYCSERTAQLLKRDLSSLKMITCHLGNGASLAAIQAGKSINTTMGFTPLEGLMMGSRSGSIDPGIIFYLAKQKNLSINQLENIFNHESGLKGIAKTSDMREIISAKEQKDSLAILAFEMYIQRLKFYIGALAASLNGLDVLVFTGGIGENAPLVREETCEGLSFLGLSIDLKKNLNNQTDVEISTTQSKVKVLIVHTRENWMIAKACFKLCSQ